MLAGIHLPPRFLLAYGDSPLKCRRGGRGLHKAAIHTYVWRPTLAIWGMSQLRFLVGWPHIGLKGRCVRCDREPHGYILLARSLGLVAGAARSLTTTSGKCLLAGSSAVGGAQTGQAGSIEPRPSSSRRTHPCCAIVHVSQSGRCQQPSTACQHSEISMVSFI